MSMRGGAISSGGDGGNIGRSNVKVARVTNTSSVTVATAITPASGKRIEIIDVNIDFTGVTSNGLEVYFGEGANIGITPNKAITEGHQAAEGPVFEILARVGAVDEVVSIRGTDNVAEAVNAIIAYKELS